MSSRASIETQNAVLNLAMVDGDVSYGIFDLKGSGAAVKSLRAACGSRPGSAPVGIEAPEGMVYCGGGAIKRQIEHLGWADEGGPTTKVLGVSGDPVGPRKLGPTYVLRRSLARVRSLLGGPETRACGGDRGADEFLAAGFVHLNLPDDGTVVGELPFERGAARRRLSQPALGVGAALVLAACSGGEENSTTGFTASAPTASSPTGFTTTVASTSAGTDGTDGTGGTDGTDTDRTTGATDPTGHETETMGGTMATQAPRVPSGEPTGSRSVGGFSTASATRRAMAGPRPTALAGAPPSQASSRSRSRRTPGSSLRC